MNTENQTIDTQAQEVALSTPLDQMVAALQAIDMDDKQQMTTKNVALLVNQLIAVVKEMHAENSALVNDPLPSRDRGPKSERTMTEEDARRIMLGDLKDASHKIAAETLQLSYGQVYSARKGFTFKTVYKEMENADKAAKAAKASAEAAK